MITPTTLIIAALSLPPGNAIGAWTQKVSADDLRCIDPHMAETAANIVVYRRDDPRQLRAALDAERGCGAYRDYLERHVAIMDEGLRRAQCMGGGDEVFDILGKAERALALALFDAYASRAAPDVVDTVLRVGARLARCEGNFVSHVAGVTIFGTAQDTAMFLTEHGVFDSAQAQALAATMRREQPGADLVRPALHRDVRALIPEIEALGVLDGRVMSVGETKRRLRDELDHLAVVAAAGAPGWVEAWDARRESLVTDADRRFVEAIRGPLDRNDIPALTRAIADFGEAPPPNIVGRLTLSIILIRGAHVARAHAKIRTAELKTRVFAHGVRSIEAARRGTGAPTGGADLRTTAKSVVGETSDGERVEFSLERKPALAPPPD